MTLVVVLVVTAALTVLGIGVLGLGTLETSTARSGLASAQAAFAAESGLSLVKHWFDAPAGSAQAWLVPAPFEIDRTLRGVDPDGDGTFQPFAQAPAPSNVVYRQGREDLFDRPYRGDPSLALVGDARAPDILIADDAENPSVRAFLRRLDLELFPAGPGPGLALRLRRIVVYAPPSVSTGGVRTRVGIASVEVTAALVRTSGDTEEILASARASGALQEIPYGAPGPLTTSAGIAEGEGFDLRWGTVSAAQDVDLGPNPRAATPSGWPWRSLERRLTRDADGDGSSDDTDGDGAVDLDEWLGLPDSTLADPWFRLLAGGAIGSAPTVTPQPYPFDPRAIPGEYATDDDRSALFQRLGLAAAYAPDAALFRAAAADGGVAAHLFRFVPGSSPPLFREGDGEAVDFETATRGREGLFYFDTADSLPPRDEDGDGSADNLTPPIVVADPGWWASGCLFINAAAFALQASTREANLKVAPPGEPFDDRDGDGTCGPGEPYLVLSYPADPFAPGAVFTRLGVRACGDDTPRQTRGPWSRASLTYSGLILTSGGFGGGGGVRVFGAVAASGGVTGASAMAPGSEPLQILYDSGLAEGGWPPPSSRLPRTVWQRRSVAQ